ncbi:hypothetical protein C4D60_Mb04t38990 [Musa balbisiana]|uniref:Secreted protein n=1 Tax=Musa balbisiana TaxID=52838 RepID=A0A4S8KHZ9_MUSBA|nr:hypothetical protein C4D60_Mb04t38990 [Musa balbisiana]
MRRHSVVSERATLLFLLALTCVVSSSLERSSPLILPSSSSCLARLQLGVLCCFLPSLAIHIPTRPGISPPLFLLEQQHRTLLTKANTQHTLIGFIPSQILSERLTRFLHVQCCQCI